MARCKVVKEDAALSIIGTKILAAHVEVVDPVRISEVGVVGKGCAVGELKIINPVAYQGNCRCRPLANGAGVTPEL